MVRGSNPKDHSLPPGDLEQGTYLLIQVSAEWLNSNTSEQGTDVEVDLCLKKIIITISVFA